MKTIKLNVEFSFDDNIDSINNQLESIFNCCDQLNMKNCVVVLTKQIKENNITYTLGAIDNNNLLTNDKLIIADDLTFIVDRSKISECETTNPDVIIKMVD